MTGIGPELSPWLPRRPRIVVLDACEGLCRKVAGLLGGSAEVDGVTCWSAAERSVAERVVPDAFVVGSGFGLARGLEYGAVLARVAPMRVLLVVCDVTDGVLHRACEAGVVLAPAPTDAMLRALLRSADRSERPTPEFARSRVSDEIGARLKLSEREGDVVRCLLEGLDATDIAGALGISERTVQVHLSRILRKARLPKTQLFVVKALHAALELLSDPPVAAQLPAAPRPLEVYR